MIISMKVWNFLWYTAGRSFSNTAEHGQEQKTQKTTEKNMESMLIVQKVAGGLCGSTSENVRRSS